MRPGVLSRLDWVPPAWAALSLFVFAFLVGRAGAYKLNVPKVLLPFSRDKRVPFLLGAEGGCYTWYSTRHDIVTIEPVFENSTVCSQRALLTTCSTQAAKLVSVVIAEEIVTGHLLRCDIIVDLIDHVEIISRTREIYVEDSPLELSVRALDAEEPMNNYSVMLRLRKPMGFWAASRRA